MTRPVRLGVLTPSSNTVVEPLTTKIIAGLPEVTAHFSRFKVTEIALSGPAIAQFDDSEILRAAELLAHAKVDVIGWSGTSSGWLGFDRDIQLCERIKAATGIPGCTAMLALNDLFAAINATKIGLVTPYTDDVQRRIIAHYEGIGLPTIAERHLGIRDNFSFCEISPETIAAMSREVAAKKPDAIAIICTNLRGAPLAAGLEAESGIPIFDTVATTVWRGLKIAGVDPARVTNWGRLFAIP